MGSDICHLIGLDAQKLKCCVKILIKSFFGENWSLLLTYVRLHVLSVTSNYIWDTMYPLLFINTFFLDIRQGQYWLIDKHRFLVTWNGIKMSYSNTVYVYLKKFSGTTTLVHDTFYVILLSLCTALENLPQLLDNFLK